MNWLEIKACCLDYVRISELICPWWREPYIYPPPFAAANLSKCLELLPFFKSVSIFRSSSFFGRTLRLLKIQVAFTEFNDMSSHTCPCCSYTLLRHIRAGGVYWFCSHCHQEMPNFFNSLSQKILSILLEFQFKEKSLDKACFKSHKFSLTVAGKKSGK